MPDAKNLETPNLDEALSPENWPPFDPVRHGAALERDELKRAIRSLMDALRDLIQLADQAMLEANRDGAEYDRERELHGARAVLQKEQR